MAMYDDIENKYLWMNNLVIFSLKSMVYNHDTGKKQTEGDFKGWNNLTKGKIKKGDKVFCVATGKKSNVTVLDFDNYKDYDRVVNEGIFENNNLYPTVKTRRGYHVYFTYDTDIKQPNKDILNVDVLNDNKRAYWIGTEYKIPYISYGDEECQEQIFTYEWEFLQELQPIPDKLKNYINSLNNKKEIKTETKTETKTNNKTLQYCELINEEYLNNRDDWLKIVFAMKRENIDEIDALRISNKATDCVPLTDEAWSNVWDREDERENGCNIGTIKYYAKLSDGYEYYKLELQNMKHYDILKKTINQCTEYKLANLYHIICPDRIVYVKEEDKFYTWYNDKWNEEVKKTGSYCRRLINTILTKYLSEYNIKICNIKKYETEDDEDENNKIYKKEIQKVGDILVLIEKTTWINNIWNELQAIIITNNKNIQFDDNPNVIAFNNLKYDFIKKEFSKIVHDDYITLYTNYDWIEPNEDQIKTIKDLFEKIFPNEERRKCYLSVLYSCCIGGVKDKFIIANGDGGNGKGVLNELTYDMLGDYSYEGNTNILTEKIKNGANPELANMDKKRMIIYKEFNTEDKLRLDVLKKLVDNEFINARGLYSSKTETKLEATNIMEVNTRIKFSGKIGGDSEARRLVDVLFESTFTDDPDILKDTTRNYVYAKDKRFKAKEFKQQYRCALFKYIVDNAKTEIYVPDIVKARTNEYIDKNDELLNWFNDNYQLTSEVTDIVKIKDVFDLYKDSDEYQALYKKERPNLSRFTEDIKSNKHLRSKYKDRIKIEKTNTTMRSVLQGVILIEKEEKDDEDE